jgi:hypothetical protein
LRNARSQSRLTNVCSKDFSGLVKSGFHIMTFATLRLSVHGK